MSSSRRSWLSMVGMALLCWSGRACAEEAGLEERIADILVWIIIVVIPLLGLYLFWKVHVLPEVFAEKNQHPQKKAIQVLCLLSLLFGGMLWPLAWLWAFTKPVLYRAAYGTDKHEDFYSQRDAHDGPGPLTDELKSEVEHA